MVDTAVASPAGTVSGHVACNRTLYLTKQCPYVSAMGVILLYFFVILIMPAALVIIYTKYGLGEWHSTII